MRKKTYIVLFNYGGGMRGLIPAHLMAKIEEKTGLGMAEMVDVFAGPSTGAIINSALNIPSTRDPKKPKFGARHMVRFYEREGAKIFPADSFREFRAFIHDFNNRTMKIGQLQKLFRHGHYSPSHLQYCLKELYGTTKISHTLKNLVIPVYNIDKPSLEVAQEIGETEDTPVRTHNNFRDSGGQALWLKNMNFERNREAPPDVALHDAVLASCAAPTYFPCHHFSVKTGGGKETHHYTGIDGSIFDNPCISYYGAIRHHLPKDANVIMILFGTGYTLRSYTQKDWNKLGGLGVVDPVNDLPLINILFHAPESALLDGFTQELEDNIFSFNKSLLSTEIPSPYPSLGIDDASPQNLEKMKNFAHSMIEDNEQRFNQLCNLLVSNYEAGNEDKSSGFWSKILK